MKNPVALFFENLEAEGLAAPSDGCLVAVSGGVDSVALAHFFAESGRPFAIAHCNFGLRGEESEGDERFARELAGRLGAAFFCGKFDTAAVAATRKISIQMAARELRYSFFEKTRAANGFRFIATAHHLDDSRETALLNFFRGTGLRGLRGMLPVRGPIVRPLLGFSKKEVLAEALRCFPSMAWREDSSNQKADYDRNFLRHELLPVIEKLAPGFFEKTLGANMARAREAELFLEKAVVELLPEAVQTIGNQTVVQLEPVMAAASPHLFLGEILRPFGFREVQIQPILDCSTGERGRRFFSKEWRLTVDAQRLFIESIGGKEPVFEIHETDLDGPPLELPGGFFSMKTGAGEAGERSADRVFFEKKGLAFPLRLRHWRPGDRFRPSGMGGRSKKLQDFFTDLKLARPEKDRAWLLENGDGELLWLVGLRRCDRAEGAADACFEWRPF